MPLPQRLVTLSPSDARSSNPVDLHNVERAELVPRRASLLYSLSSAAVEDLHPPTLKVEEGKATVVVPK